MKHSEEYIEAYRAGFYDGADCKQNFKLHMLGYEVDELLKIINEYEMQNKLMTKAEITRIIQNIVFGLTDTGQAEKWTEALEALGLIEFKKEYASSVEMAIREKFRQALADGGHSEATVYGHWALSAYDIAHKD